jgi:hypothetical protein
LRYRYKGLRSRILSPISLPWLIFSAKKGYLLKMIGSVARRKMRSFRERAEMKRTRRMAGLFFMNGRF